MNLLVTGAAGFIGFNLCKELLKINSNINNVIGIDNLNNYYSVKFKRLRIKELNKSKKFKFLNINISNKKNLEKIFKKYSFKEVYNLAAQAGVRYSLINPEAYIDSNVNGFSNLIYLSKKYNVKKFYYASSSSIYSENNKFPLKENSKLEPRTLYGVTKKYNEELADIYFKSFNFKSIGLRFFTVFGEWGRPDMFIMKLLIAHHKRKKFYLNNYGKHFRDFTYIKDVIQIMLKLRKIKPKKNEIYNICSNNPVGLLAIIKLLNNKITNVKIKKAKRQNADIYKTHGDNSKLKKIINFRKFTKFETSLNNTVDWFFKNKKKF